MDGIVELRFGVFLKRSDIDIDQPNSNSTIPTIPTRISHYQNVFHFAAIHQWRRPVSPSIRSQICRKRFYSGPVWRSKNQGKKVRQVTEGLIDYACTTSWNRELVQLWWSQKTAILAWLIFTIFHGIHGKIAITRNGNDISTNFDNQWSLYDE